MFMDNLNQTWTNLEFVYELVRTGLYCGAVAVTPQTLILHQSAATIIIVIPLWRPLKPLYCDHNRNFADHDLELFDSIFCP